MHEFGKRVAVRIGALEVNHALAQRHSCNHRAAPVILEDGLHVSLYGQVLKAPRGQWPGEQRLGCLVYRNVRDVADFALAPGNYVVAAHFSSADQVINSASGQVYGPGVSYVGDRWSSGNGFPMNEGQWGGRYAANFKYGEVPAPGVLAMFGLAGLASRRRRG